MKAWIKDNIDFWINNTALLFTIVMMQSVIMGYDIYREQVAKVFIICAVLSSIAFFIWGNRKLSRKWKYIVHYSICYIVCVVLNGLLFGLEMYKRWSIEGWFIFWFQFTLFYVLINWYVIWRSKKQVKVLNDKLAEFKKKYQ